MSDACARGNLAVPEDHKLEVTYESGKLIATCACGQWRQEKLIRPGERISQVMQVLEEEFAKHAAGGR